MSTAKNIQAKVFGGQDATPPPNSSSSGEIPALSIQIPRPPPFKLPTKKQSQSTMSPPSKKKEKEANGAPDVGAVRQDETFKARLLKKLGTRYDGVERYRLEQSENKEKHWKRWGPYLSERQWVRSTSPSSLRLSPSPCLGHSS